MRLIRGAPGSGKTAQIFQQFREAVRAGRTDIRIVVPTATLVRHFQHELARDGLVFGPNLVTSFSHFTSEFVPHLKLVPEGLNRVIVRDALRHAAISEFAAVAETEGMTATIIDTIRQFENAGCTPDVLSRVRKLPRLGQAFARIWKVIDTEIKARGYVGHADLIRAAAANVRPMCVWMDGFIAFSPLEAEFVRALGKECDLTVALSDSPAADEARRLALQIGAEDRLLKGSSRQPQASIVAASYMEREADEIARRIIELHDRSTPLRAIAVALPDPVSYLPLLRSTFERFGIPARFYFSSALRHHPVARLLGGLIRGILTGWEHAAVIEALRTHPHWGASAAFDRFEFAVRERAPGRGAQTLLEFCRDDWFRQELAQCLAIDGWRSDHLRPRDWKFRLTELTAVYRPQVPQTPADQAGLEAARGHVAALEAWSAAIEQAAVFWTDPEQLISLEQFWRVASDAVEGATFRIGDNRRNVVHVMDAYEARQWDVAALFVCGATDGQYPKRHQQNLLFDDCDALRLRAAGIPVRTAADLDREEEWLFASLRTRATAELVISYPMHDASGKRIEPSRFLLDLKEDVSPSRLVRPALRIAPGNSARAGRIDSPSLLSELAAKHKRIRATALDELAQCRFKFFARYALELACGPERPEDRLTKRVSGIILHRALEDWRKDPTVDFVPLFERAFDSICAQECIPRGYKLEVERIQLREIAEKIRATERWNADRSEVEVDLELKLPNGLEIACRADRIDIFGNDCVVIDYKSSKIENVKKLVTSPAKLQGPIYALAAHEHSGLNLKAMVYWAIRNDQLYGWGSIPGTDLTFNDMPFNWMEDARQRTMERVSSYLKGEIHPLPADTDECRWCDFANACRVEEQKLVLIEGAHGA